MNLTALERDALELVLLNPPSAGDEGLKYQIDFANVTARDFTGAGMFVEFEVPDRLAVHNSEHHSISNLNGSSETLVRGFGGVLFVEQGKIRTLEFFTYDEPWPEDLGNYKLWIGSIRRTS